ncbi:MAG: sulfate ABC transporter permease subunit CysW, partial [Stellaceae bacterium]
MAERQARGRGGAARPILIGLAIAFLTVVLIAPLVLLFSQAFANGISGYIGALLEPDTLQAIELTLLIAAIVVPLNAAFGLIAAWGVAKFDFPGKSVLVSMIDLPISVSPVVAGLAFVLVFGAQGWLGPLLSAHGIKVIFALPGMVLATAFVTIAFVARQLIPLMQQQGREEEEAAVVLGARSLRLFWHVTLPNIRWALIYGVLLCNARAMGEFGAVSVVSGHIRGVTDTMPLQVEALFNDYQIEAAFAVASLLA